MPLMAIKRQDGKTVMEGLKRFRQALGLTQEEMADRLDITRPRYADYETARRQKLPDMVLERLHLMGYMADVGLPSSPATEGEVALVSIGYVSAAMKIDWTDPFQSEDWEYVPSHMVADKGLFTCRVESDCMVPLLYPEDVCIWKVSPVPRIGAVTLYLAKGNQLTIKQLKHDGSNYILHPLNPRFEDNVADGVPVGYLVGIVRTVGRRKITDYDPDGIRP